MRIDGDWRSWLRDHPDATPLDEGLHRIAIDEGATMSLAAVRAQLDDLAAGVPRRGSPDDRLDAFVRHLFGAEGFEGDSDTYDDPANSRLDRVLERRRGNPILLSAVAMEVGRRAGVPLAGIPFPGHFLVSTLDEPRRFLDPFHGGERLPRADLMAELRRRYPKLEDVNLATALRPTSTVELLIRVSSNLLASWQRRGDLRAALRSADRRVALAPERPDLVRERGLLLAELGAHVDAAFDLGEWITRAGPTEPREEIAIRWRLSVLAWERLVPRGSGRIG